MAGSRAICNEWVSCAGSRHLARNLWGWRCCLCRWMLHWGTVCGSVPFICVDHCPLLLGILRIGSVVVLIGRIVLWLSVVVLSVSLLFAGWFGAVVESLVEHFLAFGFE